MTVIAPPIHKLSRRQLLGTVAATGVTVALGGEGLSTYPPWLDYDAQTRRVWDTPFQKGTTGTARMRELIRYATLAPSGHNTQPWKFAIFGDIIRIFPDYTRRLPTVDPQNRELWISLGCALENLIIAAQYVGYDVDVTYPEITADYLLLHLKPSLIRQPSPLFGAIAHRQSARSVYEERSVSADNLKKIEAVTAATGIFSRVFTTSQEKEAILEYVKMGDAHQESQPAFGNELVSWLRFNKPEALHTLDGLYTRCAGNPEVPRWLGELFVLSGGVGQQSATDEKAVRSSSGLIVIASAHDDKRDWIETGRFYERLALTLTAWDIKTAFINQALEVVSLRSEFQRYLNLGTAQPQLLFRFGYASVMPRSLRRPVEQVIIA